MLKLNTKDNEVRQMTVLTKDYEIHAVFSKPAEESNDNYYFLERVMALIMVEDKAGDISVIPYGYDREDMSTFEAFIGLINKEDESDLEDSLNAEAKKNMRKHNIKFTDFSTFETAD